jgi:hypothetical protein
MTTTLGRHWASIGGPTLAELRWADAGPMSKYASDQRRRPMSGRRTQLRWADVGPMYVCYLGMALTIDYIVYNTSCAYMCVRNASVRA